MKNKLVKIEIYVSYKDMNMALKKAGFKANKFNRGLLKGRLEADANIAISDDWVEEINEDFYYRERDECENYEPEV